MLDFVLNSLIFKSKINNKLYIMKLILIKLYIIYVLNQKI